MSVLALLRKARMHQRRARLAARMRRQRGVGPFAAPDGEEYTSEEQYQRRNPEC